MPLLTLLLASLIGCQPDCTDFGDMTVDDPDELLVPTARFGIDSALSDFEAWTGRSGVCVPAVEVFDNRDDHYSGYYSGPGRPIHVAPMPDGTHRVTVHELCHAVDQLEVMVEDHARLFDEDLLNDDDYKGDKLRRAEVFARICERGPDDVGLATRLRDECGIDIPLLPQRSYMNRHVYTEVQALPWDSPDHSGAPGLARSASMDISNWWPQSSVVNVEQSAFSLAQYGRGGRSGTPQGLFLIEQDLDDRSILSHRRLDLGSWDGATLGYVELVPGDDGVYAWAVSYDNPAWHIDLTTAVATRVPSLTPEATTRPLAVVGGRVLESAHSEEGFRSLRLRELDSGDEVALDLPIDPWGKGIHVYDAWLDGDDVVLWTHGEGVARVNMPTASIDLEVTRPPGLQAYRDERLPDGRLALEMWEWDRQGQAHAAVVVLDPSDGSWHTPVDLCEQVYDPYDQSLTRTADGVALVDVVHDADGQAGVVLRHLELDVE